MRHVLSFSPFCLFNRLIYMLVHRALLGYVFEAFTGSRVHLQ